MMRKRARPARNLDPLGDVDAWHEAFGPYLKQNPGLAEVIGRLLSVIRDSGESKSSRREVFLSLSGRPFS
ncbi:MAG: hypothetical protein ACREAC_21835 [Blastocatellia bacterium]